jgi:hypothetical protein
MFGRGYLSVIAMILAGTAQAQISAPANLTNPNRVNEDIQQRADIEAVNDQRARKQTGPQGDVAHFLEAIKPRKHLFADFDQVVIHGKAPATPGMLALMAQSPYAADIAYFLGSHPEQSGAIAQMQPEEARVAMKQIEASAAASNPIRK